MAAMMIIMFDRTKFMMMLCCPRHHLGPAPPCWHGCGGRLDLSSGCPRAWVVRGLDAFRMSSCFEVLLQQRAQCWDDTICAAAMLLLFLAFCVKRIC